MLSTTERPLKRNSLDLLVFMHAVGPELLDRYFSSVDLDEARQGWFHLNVSAFQHWCDEPANEERAQLILEDFGRMEEVSRSGAGLLIRAYARFGLEKDDARTPQQLAMVLFLDHDFAFSFARSKYLLYGGAATLSVFLFGKVDFALGPDQEQAFKKGVEHWFGSQAKGEECFLSCYEEHGEVAFLIQRGSYFQTRPIWQDQKIAVSRERPSIEDVLTFEVHSGELRVKTGQTKDREQYVRLFARDILGDENLAERALHSELFTLGPLRDGKFNYRGKGPIKRVDLVAVRLRLYGAHNTIVTLRSADIPAALKYDVKGLSLASGTLVAAWFKFHVQHPGEKRATPVSFKIEPPARTDLTEKKQILLILNYLQEQGVKLQ
jgi:hypothetical protein